MNISTDSNLVSKQVSVTIASNQKSIELASVILALLATGHYSDAPIHMNLGASTFKIKMAGLHGDYTILESKGDTVTATVNIEELCPIAELEEQTQRAIPLIRGELAELDNGNIDRADIADIAEIILTNCTTVEDIQLVKTLKPHWVLYLHALILKHSKDAELTELLALYDEALEVDNILPDIVDSF